jgi:arylsulfatase A-like enzyme
MLSRIRRTPAVWALVVALAAAGFYAGHRIRQGSQAVIDPRPVGTAADIAALSERKDLNVLFVLIDTLRADHVSSYGYGRRTSPVMDMMAASGVRFARQLSQSSWTKCSMASLWTGLNPARSGVTRFEHVLPDVARLPAEILRDAGFRTAGIFRNGWVEGYFGFDQGFEIYTRPMARPPPPSVRRANPTIHYGGSDMDAVAAAIEFLRIYGRERWFLYVHLMDVHEYVYDESTAEFGTAHVDVYDNAVLRENAILNHLMTYVRDEGYLENTLTVVASDHGEAFGERGFEGHARNVYPEVTGVPLIFSFPFRLEPGVVVDQRTSNVDIWPTLLELLGLPPLEGVDGRSRVPEILAAARGEAGPADDSVSVAHLDQSWGQRVSTARPTVAISQEGFHYVMFRSAQGKVREELLGAADGEQGDMLDAEPETASRLRGVAERYLDGRPPWRGGVPTLELDEIQLNQLRALGYAVP